MKLFISNLIADRNFLNLVVSNLVPFLLNNTQYCDENQEGRIYRLRDFQDMVITKRWVVLGNVNFLIIKTTYLTCRGFRFFDLVDRVIVRFICNQLPNEL
jgi:hypothetical protein